jgi:MFS family permease
MASKAALGGHARALVLLLGAAVFLNYVDRNAIGVAAPLLKGELGLTATQFGVAVSAFFWVYGPIQLVVGWLCDRFSVYRLLGWGVALWAAATLLSGFVGGFVSLIVLRLMLGIGESFAFPASSKIIAEQVPPEGRGMANAAVSMGIALGPALGTLAGGAILASLGWRPVFIIFGLLTLIWLLPWQRVTRGLESSAPPVGTPRVPISALIRRWPLWSMSIAHFASNYGFYFVLAWLPLYLVSERGLSVPQMTLLATLGYAAQAVAAFAFGAISDRWTRSGKSEDFIRRWMMIAAQFVQAAAILGIFYAGSIPVLAIWLCLAGIATGALSLNIFAVAQMFAGPRATGTWVGVQNALGNFSGILGPIVTGIIVDAAGYDYAFIAAAAVIAAGGLWWIVGVPKIEQLSFGPEQRSGD